MAVGEKKVSEMTFLESVPDNAKLYIVVPGELTKYYTTKAALLSGVSNVNTYATFDFVKKGFGNLGTTPGAAGDIYQGWVSDGVYCPVARYDGSGPLDDPASFEIVVTHIYEPPPALDVGLDVGTDV
jgi:hypothetical protein